MTTARDTPHRLQRTGSSVLSGYRFLVTEAEAPTNEAKAAQRRLAAVETAAAEARRERDVAIIKMHAAGMSPGAIAKELTWGEHKMSATNVRLIINVHRGPRTKDGSKA